jgi:large subunit ribosomal protein L17
MKKRNPYRRLGRSTSHKWALLRNLVTSLIKHERIVTTVPKAKELRRLADHVVTLAKEPPEKRLHAIRQANAIIYEKPVLTKLFEVLGPRYEKREGGYTRVLKLSQRRVGDNAEMAVMEYVDRPGEIRAARPPSSFQREIMEKFLKEKLGINPPTEEHILDLESNMESLSMNKEKT